MDTYRQWKCEEIYFARKCYTTCLCSFIELWIMCNLYTILSEHRLLLKYWDAVQPHAFCVADVAFRYLMTYTALKTKGVFLPNLIIAILCRAYPGY